MKYVIVYLIKGKAAKFQQKLAYKIARKFDHYGTVKNKIPAHLTLKLPFETNDIKRIQEVENIIKNFSNKQKISTLILDGYGYFENPWVAYINAKESKQMRNIYNKFIDELKRIDLFTFREYEIHGPKFHSTLAHSDLAEEKFKEIWKYLKTQPKPYFHIKFDNITILKLTDDIWQIHKEFLIK